MAQIRNPGSIRLEGAPYGAGSGRDLFNCYYHYSDFLSDVHFFSSFIRRFRWDW